MTKRAPLFALSRFDSICLPSLSFGRPTSHGSHVLACLETETFEKPIMTCFRPSRSALCLALLICLWPFAVHVHGLSWHRGPVQHSVSSSSWRGDGRRLSSSMISLSLGYRHAESSSFVTSLALLHQQDATPDRHLFSRPRRRSRHATVLFMGKGDGKKKRKKKSPPAASSAAAPASSSPPPQRVSADINVPVRMQIRYGQMRKEAAKQSGTSFRRKKVERTKYRRSWDEEEIEVKREERKRKGQDPNWDVILSRTANAPLVIVDGYNIINKWSRLKKHMVKGDTQRARQLLLDDLENLQSLKGWRIEVVFDGAGRPTTGPLGQGMGRITADDRVERKSVTKHGVRTVFTGVGVEADSYIEARCARARNVTGGETTGSFIVATDDGMIRLAGQSAGAFCMGAARFVDELKATKKALEYRVEAAVAKANGQAIRPEKLRGTHFHGFGRNQILIEDKRDRNKKPSVDDHSIDDEDDLDIEIEVDENGVPWWAKMPDQEKFDS